MAAKETEDVTLVLAPGPAGQIEVRITRGYDEELEQMLTEAGLYQGRKIELAAEIATVVLIILGTVKAVKDLHPVLIAWFNRHEHTKIEMFEDGTVKSVSGTSAKKATHVIDRFEGTKKEYDRRMAEIEAELQQRSVDPGEHRPGGPVPGA